MPLDTLPYYVRRVTGSEKAAQYAIRLSPALLSLLLLRPLLLLSTARARPCISNHGRKERGRRRPWWKRWTIKFRLGTWIEPTQPENRSTLQNAARYQRRRCRRPSSAPVASPSPSCASSLYSSSWSCGSTSLWPSSAWPSPIVPAAITARTTLRVPSSNGTRIYRLPCSALFTMGRHSYITLDAPINLRHLEFNLSLLIYYMWSWSFKSL